MKIPRHERKVRILMTTKASTDDILRDEVLRLTEAGHEISARVIWNPGDGETLASEAIAEGINLLIAAGGDGTLNEVVNGVMASGQSDQVEMGLLPYGTGNDFYSQTGFVTANPHEGLVRILESTPTPIDLGRMNGRWFVNMATGGMGARVTTEAPAEMKRVLGSLAYMLSGVVTALSEEPTEVKIRAEGLEWGGGTYVICVANGCRTGGGIEVCPGAKLDDGLFDLVIVPATTLDRKVVLAAAATQGTLLSEPEVIHRRTSWVEVTSQETIQFNADGEPAHDTRFRFEVERRSLKFHVTAEAGEQDEQDMAAKSGGPL